jgi:hypothetical protein
MLALIIRIVWGLTQLQRGFLFVSEGDYTLYQIGAEHFLKNGNFNNSLFLVRPPLLSVIIALFNDNHLIILLLNTFLGALIAPLTMLLSQQLGLPRRVAIIAGIVIALDILHVRYTAFLGPESLSFVTALGMVCCLIALQQAEKGYWAVGWGVLAALMLLISAYSRPSIYLIWTGLSVWLFILRPRFWYAVLVFAVLSFAGIQVWTQHNARAFGNPSFSTVSAYTMAYYRAASVLNQANPQMSIDDVYIEIGRRVETRLGRNPDDVDLATQHGYLAASPEIEQALNATSLEIFRTYPEWYVITLGVGAVRYFNLLPVFPPFENLLDITRYPPIVYNWIVLSTAVVGLLLLIKHRQWTTITIIILFSGYFTVGTLLVKSAGMTSRERGVIMPLIAIASAYGFYALHNYWKKRKANAPITL